MHVVCSNTLFITLAMALYVFQEQPDLNTTLTKYNRSSCNTKPLASRSHNIGSPRHRMYLDTVCLAVMSTMTTLALIVRRERILNIKLLTVNHSIKQINQDRNTTRRACYSEASLGHSCEPTIVRDTRKGSEITLIHKMPFRILTSAAECCP